MFECTYSQEKDNVLMQGIQFVTDDKGQKVAVQINLKKFGDLWEDFYDSLLFHKRALEPRESIASVKERLKRQGKLHG
jgi:hypothetical protein